MIPTDLLSLAKASPRSNWPAVYFLIIADEVVYVGGSIHPALRVKQHRQQYGRPFDRVLYLPTARRYVEAAEREWIRRLCPKHNKQGNPRPDSSAISWGEMYGHHHPQRHMEEDPGVFHAYRIGGPKAVMLYRKRYGVEAKPRRPQPRCNPDDPPLYGRKVLASWKRYNRPVYPTWLHGPKPRRGRKARVA